MGKLVSQNLVTVGASLGSSQPENPLMASIHVTAPSTVVKF